VRCVAIGVLTLAASIIVTVAGCIFRARKAIVSRQAGPWFHAMPVQCS
jgi:hypothetical protein